MLVPYQFSALTVLRLQFGAGLGRHEAGHEAVACVLWTQAALGGGRGGAYGGSDVRPGDHRGGGGHRRGAGSGAGRDVAGGGQVLFVVVQVDGVQTHLSCGARLALVLDR